MPTTDKQDEYSSIEVAEMAGVTYRQLDYWLRTGWLNIGSDGHGSGSRRRFTRAEALALVRIVKRYTAAKSAIEDIRSGVAWRDELAEVSEL